MSKTLSPKNTGFLERVSEELSGRVVMLADEAHGDVSKMSVLISQLLSLALFSGKAVFQGDEKKALRTIRRILEEWENIANDDE